MEKKTILIIGYGRVGKLISSFLLKDSFVKKLIVSDKVPRVIPKNKKINFTKIQLFNKEQILKLIDKSKPDLVVNTALPLINNLVLACCASKKVNYIDTASLLEPRYKVMELGFNRLFKRKGITGLICAGVSPGLTNLFAREAADLLDKVDSIKIRLIEDTKTDGLHFPWSKEWLLDELYWKPHMFVGNKFKVLDNFAGEEEYNFPEPIGKRKVALICQDEASTLPLFIKARNVDIKAHDNQIALYKFLVLSKFLSREKMGIGKGLTSPLEFTTKMLPDQTDWSSKKFHRAHFAFALEVNGKKDGKNKAIKYFIEFPEQKKINRMAKGANFISYPTALSAYLFIKSFFKINKKGVFPPEVLEREVRSEVLSGLRKYNIKVRRSSKLISN